jgi:hypothetical protein
MRHLERRTGFGEQRHRKIDVLLLGGIQLVPPLPEFIRELDFPRHLT